MKPKTESRLPNLDSVALWAAALAIFVLSLKMLDIVAPYLSWRLDIDFLLTKQHILYLKHYRVAFYTHIFSGCVCLLSGLPQFSRWLLRKGPKLHRWLGYTYVVSVLGLAGPSGFVMALYANGGFAAEVAFLLLSVLWWWYTFQALNTALQRRWQLHRAFMIRSFALSISALTLRFYVKVLPLFVQVSGDELYVAVAWLGWVPNLIVAEALIRRGFLSKFPLRKEIALPRESAERKVAVPK